MGESRLVLNGGVGVEVSSGGRGQVEVGRFGEECGWGSGWVMLALE